jgi:transcriptional regulator with XRE-family HTH domain
MIMLSFAFLGYSARSVVAKRVSLHQSSCILSGVIHMDVSTKSSDHNTSKKPGEMDQYIGSRLRLWRRTMAVDAYALAARVGITYQQLQKYEKGVNRISATRLYAISRELNVPIDYFYHEAASHRAIPAADGEFETDQRLMLMANGSGANLLKCFVAIKDADVRKAVLNLLRTIATDEPAAPPPVTTLES